jgi:acetylornithine deacetylase/succinyl-diaminopimelate desuccinylase-like protein
VNNAILDHLKATSDRHIDDLATFVRMPTIAATGQGVRETAAWLIDFMRGIGIDPIVDEDANFPVILAEIPGASERSLLVYAHYDVQPADEPEWLYPSFGAEIHDGRMYGRGTVDDKGPVMVVLEALRAYHELGVKPPVTVKLLIEGEEEVSSPSLRPVLERHRDFLSCDGLVNYDDNVWSDGRPRIVCGLKGTAGIRLSVTTRREYHAMFASVLTNAIWRLHAALATLADADGNITIDGFFDDVVPPTDAEMRALVELNWTGRELLEESGQSTLRGGREGLAALRHFLLEPSFNLQGIAGGYVSPNKKSVVPHHAVAEIRFGTVPNQTGERIRDLVVAHLAARGFDDVQVELYSENPWARASIEGRLATALGRSLTDAFDRGLAVQPSYAGSGPEGIFQQMWPHMEQAYSGFGPTENNLHAPNEYIVVDDYLRGIESFARLLHYYGEDA